MTTYNTLNPIGSTAVKDLYDNAENLDTAVNTEEKTWVDRLGRTRLSMEGMSQAAGDATMAIEAAQRSIAAADESEAARDIALQAAELAQNSSASIFRPTLAQLQAVTDRPANSPGVVTNDPDPSKNGYYVWSGTSWDRSAVQPANSEQLAETNRGVEFAIARAFSAQQTWALPNRSFDLSDPVRLVCSRSGEILWYHEPQTGRLRARYASSDRLWAYPYRSFLDNFMLPTVDAAGRVVGDLSAGKSAAFDSGAPLHASFDAESGILKCSWRHGDAEMWRTTYQRNGFNDLWNWRSDEVAPLGDPTLAAWVTVPGRVTSSDSFPPLQVVALADGDGSTTVIYTGGNHGSNGDASGLKTARMVSLQISVDSRVLQEGESFSGYVDRVAMRWENELMGYNTVSLGRYILRQAFDFAIRPGDVSGYCSVRALEAIGMRVDNSLQHFAAAYETYHFYSGQSPERLNIADATSDTNSGPKNTYPSWASVLAGPYGYHGVWSDRSYGAGGGQYLHGSAAFFRYGGNGKFYSNVLGGGGVVDEFPAGQGYDWHAGYFYAPLVEGIDSAFTFTKRRRPHLGYSALSASSGLVKLPDYVAGAEVQDVGVDGVFGISISASGYVAAAKLIEV